MKKDLYVKVTMINNQEYLFSGTDWNCKKKVQLEEGILFYVIKDTAISINHIVSKKDIYMHTKAHQVLPSAEDIIAEKMSK